MNQLPTFNSLTGKKPCKKKQFIDYQSYPLISNMKCMKQEPLSNKIHGSWNFLHGHLITRIILLKVTPNRVVFYVSIRFWFWLNIFIQSSLPPTNNPMIKRIILGLNVFLNKFISFKCTKFQTSFLMEVQNKQIFLQPIGSFF